MGVKLKAQYGCGLVGSQPSTTGAVGVEHMYVHMSQTEMSVCMRALHMYVRNLSYLVMTFEQTRLVADKQHIHAQFLEHQHT